MTQQSNLSLTLQPRPGSTGDGPGRFCTLEQADVPPGQQYVTIGDIYRLWLRALSGIAAGRYSTPGCPVAFERVERKNEDGELVEVMTARVWLDFFVFPSSPELDFQLAANVGTIGTPEIVSKPRQRSLVFEMKDYFDLDFYPLAASLSWESGCYIEDSVSIACPMPVFFGNRIKVGRPIFAVGYLSATAYVRKYRLTMVFDKGDDRIQNLEPIITCAWMGADGKYTTAQLELVVPECVKAALALCNGDIGDIVCNQGDAEPITTVYVGECNGSILDVRTDDPESPCGRSS